MEDLLKNIIYSSISNLFVNNNDFFEFSSETNMTEWNLSHHLSLELHKYLFWLNHDLDVTKRNYGNRRPDIIFHKRRTNSLNFLVVEIKKNRNDKRSDIQKIKEDWMAEPLEYQFGSYINIWGPNQYEAILFTAQGKEIEINALNCNKLSFPDIDAQTKGEINDLVEEIISSPVEMHLNQDLNKKILKVYS